MAKPPYVQVYLSDSEKAAFQARAKEMGMQDSAFGRFLLLRGMAQVKATEAAKKAAAHYARGSK